MHSRTEHEMVRLASATNAFQAHIWQQVLQREGIRCQVLGDYLGAGIGDIPGVETEVWVEAADLERARMILSQDHDQVEEAIPAGGPLEVPSIHSSKCCDDPPSSKDTLCEFVTS